MHFLGKKPLLCAYMWNFHAMKTAKELDNLMNVNFIKNNFILKNVGYHFSCNFNAIFNYILKKLVNVDFFSSQKLRSYKKNNGSKA